MPRSRVDLSKSLRLESGILVVVDMVGSAEVLTPRIGAEAPLRRRVCARIDDRRLVDSHRPVPTGGLNVRFAMRGGCNAEMWPKRAGLLWERLHGEVSLGEVPHGRTLWLYYLDPLG